MLQFSLVRSSLFFIILSIAVCSGCSSTSATSDVVIQKATDLGNHVGEFVVIRGKLDRGKTPTVLGVTLSYNDVPSANLFGKQVECTGRLIREVVEDAPPQSQRNDGVYYSLVGASEDAPVTMKAIELD